VVNRPISTLFFRFSNEKNGKTASVFPSALLLLIKNIIQPMPSTSNISPSERQTTRLYYLDWLRVIAVFGVFLFHAVHPFDLTDWHIKNAEQSQVVTFFIAFMFPWGMPFFFLLAGAGSWFALRRRTAGEYARKRFNRLLLPFIGGAICLMPVML
jgi:uncharacterized membrane protein